jgi:hypothetical protein
MGPFHDMRVCGSYCGASWCGDSHVSEGPGCNFTATPDSCTDACCMEHDRCCGGLGREQCNHLMVQRRRTRSAAPTAGVGSSGGGGRC